ncbi:MAG: energy transducer TonB [Rhizobacter sp.]
MDFSKRQADPRRHLIGIAFVVLFHGLLVYGLMSGLARKVIDVVRAPIETKVIEEITKPPPPPEVVVVPPPKLEAPPPPFIPPPEVQIATPPPVAPTITATIATPPPAPLTIAPPTAPPAEAPKAPPTTTRGACTKMSTPDLPGLSITGRVTMLATVAVKGGQVTSVEVSNIRGTTDRRAQRALAAAVETALREYVCPGDWPALTQEFVFNIIKE